MIALAVTGLWACGSAPPETTLAGSDTQPPGLSSDALSGAVQGDASGAEPGPGDVGTTTPDAVQDDALGDGSTTTTTTDTADDTTPDAEPSEDVGGGADDGGDTSHPDEDAGPTDVEQDAAAGTDDDTDEPTPECFTDDDCTAEQLGITGNACLYPACHAGHCVGGPTPAGEPCGASIADADAECVTSFCDGGGGCKAVILEDGLCDDGDPCTSSDACSAAGKCTGGPAVICQPISPCQLAVCDQEAGGCVPFPASNGLACDDGDPCSTETTCLDGTCTAAGNICACEDDSDCEDDGDLCNGVPSCVALPAGGKGCVVDSETVVTCPPDTDFCSETVCEKATGACVTSALPGAPCNDAVACTKGDVCHSDGSCSGTPTECDDGVPCTVDSCETVSGLCLFSPSPGAPCNDGDSCTEADECKGTVCKGIDKVCDDGSACTEDVCDPLRGACKATPLSGTGCDDGTNCTADDACLEGACVGAALDCDDDDPCTTDSCDPDAGCVHTLNDAPCDDGDACTGTDSCSGGTCAGSPIDCTDGTDCTADSCDPKTGCVVEPMDDACDDGETCTTDLCDAAAGCVAVADDTATCDDGDDCTESDACSGGSCVGQLLDCSDGVPCTLDACASGGACVHQAQDGLCDDDNPCTLGSCDTEAGCEQWPLNDSPCEDGEVCTEGDVCELGVCQPGDNVCDCVVDSDCDDGNACNGVFVCGASPSGLTSCVQSQGPVVCDDAEAGPCVASVCQPATGQCELVPVDDGTDCPDDDPCTIGEHCNGGVCLSSEPICDDGVDCTINSCKAGSGCHYAPDPAECDDGIGCTTDTCSPVDGCSSVPVGEACDDGHACTSELCDPDLDCVLTINDAACESVGDCGVGACDPNAGCVTVLDVGLCDDDDECSIDTCLEDGGCVHETASDGSPCEDGNACTTADTCVSGQCEAGSPVQCETDNGCEVGQCDPATGDCAFAHVDDGTACDDGNACTEQTTCSDGSCGGGDVAGCDDGIPCTDDGCDPASGCTFTPDDDACDDGNSCTTSTCEPGSGCATAGLPDFASCDDGVGATAPDICISAVCRGVNLRAFDITSLPWCDSDGAVARKVGDLDGNGFIIVNYDQSGALCGSGRSRVLKLNGASAPSGLTGGDSGATLTSISHDIVVGDGGQVGQISGSFVSYLFNDVEDALSDIGQTGGSWRDVWGDRHGDETSWFFVGKTGNGQSRVVQCHDDGEDIECDNLGLGLSNQIKNNGTPVAVSGEVAGDQLIGSSVALHHGDADWLLHAEAWEDYDAHDTLSSSTTRDVLRFATNDDWVCGTNGLLRRFDGASWQDLPLPDSLASMDVRAMAEVDGAVVVVGNLDGAAWLAGLGADGDPAEIGDWTAVDLGAGREAWDVHRAADGVYVVGRTTGSPADAFIWYLPLQ